VDEVEVVNDQWPQSDVKQVGLARSETGVNGAIHNLGIKRFLFICQNRVFEPKP
jgi:hypothetical protein